jgi:hypothetical protein
MPKRSSAFLPVLAVACGLLIAWVDSRPAWDDTGVTVGTLLLAAAFFAALRPRRPWLWALAVGGWIPVLGIIQSHNYGSLIAPAVALFGAYLGAFARKAMTSGPKKGNAS